VDREEIERSDFPVARRGYDTASVDAHLRRVADEIDGARTAAPPASTSLAAGASERVRSILEAAELSAAQLREEAERNASGHVERVEEAATGMVARLDALQGELDKLLEGLRASAERLTEGLSALNRQASELGSDPAEPEPEPAPVAAEPEREPEPAKPPADEAGARIIALNMALGGSTREETAAYLEEHFALADPGALLDDVYAKVGQ
jgi:DivIVA domain-containing protein